jgi:putative long chain acyl-CoA synthase
MLARSLLAYGSRSAAAAQNALEVIRYGGLETGEDPSPFRLAQEERVLRLRHYFPDDGSGPPVLLVAPQMLSADVYDVSTATSAVSMLRRGGIDPWVVDFGRPEEQPRRYERTLTELVLAISDAVDRVRAHTGRDVTLAGYSQGGLLVYQTAAYRRTDGLASVVTFGSPIDLRGTPLSALPDAVVGPAARALADFVLSRAALPGWFTRTAFRMVDPVKTLKGRLDFVRQIHDRDALLVRERQRRFIEGEGWVTWPGPALAEMMRQFIAHNRLMEGGFVLGDRTLTLADIDCPVLAFIADADILAPAHSVRAIAPAAPAATVYEATIPAGHFGLVVGSGATRRTWPLVIAWAHWVGGDGELPDSIGRTAEHGGLAERNSLSIPLPGADLLAGAAAGAARAVLSSGSQVVKSARTLAHEAAATLPRLARLEAIDAGARISMGLLLDERAAARPDQVFFLFEDRAHTYSAANRRIDAIVRGLIALGIHQGDHVGVLMNPRPSGLCLTAAINRLGAVAVLLRPGDWVSAEARLGAVKCIVADPEHAAAAAAIGSVPVFTLGGGPHAKDLPAGVHDMESIDPDGVELPKWYRPNPGRGQDLAFILFSGGGDRDGDGVRAKRITNGRWSLSAFGAASAAALTARDTVYAVAPLHHASGLLMSFGGAIAGGARLAMTDRFEPGTFWQEVRRYRRHGRVVHLGRPA